MEARAESVVLMDERRMTRQGGLRKAGTWTVASDPADEWAGGAAIEADLIGVTL